MISVSGISLFSEIIIKLFEYSYGFKTSSDAAKILMVYTPSIISEFSSKLIFTLLLTISLIPFRIILPSEFTMK